MDKDDKFKVVLGGKNDEDKIKVELKRKDSSLFQQFPLNEQLTVRIICGEQTKLTTEDNFTPSSLDEETDDEEDNLTLDEEP